MLALDGRECKFWVRDPTDASAGVEQDAGKGTGRFPLLLSDLPLDHGVAEASRRSPEPGTAPGTSSTSTSGSHAIVEGEHREVGVGADLDPPRPPKPNRSACRPVSSRPRAQREIVAIADVTGEEQRRVARRAEHPGRCAPASLAEITVAGWRSIAPMPPDHRASSEQQSRQRDSFDSPRSIPRARFSSALDSALDSPRSIPGAGRLRRESLPRNRRLG